MLTFSTVSLDVDGSPCYDANECTMNKCGVNLKKGKGPETNDDLLISDDFKMNTLLKYRLCYRNWQIYSVDHSFLGCSLFIA